MVRLDSYQVLRYLKHTNKLFTSFSCCYLIREQKTGYRELLKKTEMLCLYLATHLFRL